MTKLLGKHYHDERTTMYKVWRGLWLEIMDSYNIQHNIRNELFNRLGVILFWGLSADIHVNYGANLWDSLGEEAKRVLDDKTAR